MGQRTEQRVAIVLRVTVRGSDSHGVAFEKHAETHDVSCSGACLTGLSNFVTVGSRIEVQYKDQLAWYRVQWADTSLAGAGRVGVRCLEPGKYIWGVPPKEWAADTYDPANPAPPEPQPTESEATSTDEPTWYGGERRQFPRKACRIEAQVSTDAGSVRLPGTATDISLGGCYVEMLAPLPVDTDVEIVLSPEGMKLEMSGKVRSSQTGMGMGIAFTGMRPADFEMLQRLAPVPAKAGAAQKSHGNEVPGPRSAAQTQNAAGSRPQARPLAPKMADASDFPATPEALQAIVRLLIRKGLLTRAELTEELEKLKPTPV